MGDPALTSGASIADTRTRHHVCIRTHGTGLPEVADWTWTG
ncbi:hypothetical protein AB0H77_10145 [Streptomyces sp. NPDC050844]